MSIKEIRIGSPTLSTATRVGRNILQQLSIDFIGLIALMQTSPEVDAPAGAPARCLITFLDESCLGSRVETLWQIIARIETYEVTLVTMLRVIVLPVMVPLVQVAVLANSVGAEFFQGRLVCSDRITAHTTGCANILQQFADDGEVGSTTVAGDTMITFVRLILVLWGYVDWE